MGKNNKIIYPMMFKINRYIAEDIYYITLPQIIKQKWYEVEKTLQGSNTEFNFNIQSLQRLLETNLNNIVDISKVSVNSDDTKWIKSFKKIDIEKLIACFKIWVRNQYIEDNIDTFKNRKKPTQKTRELAEELILLIKKENFDEQSKERITLFENGQVTNREAYNLYILRIMNDLVGRQIDIKNVTSKLLYSRKNELITDTHDIKYLDSYISFVINLSLQTLPPKNEVYLNVDLSIRRWANNKKNKYEKNKFLPNKKNCYVRVDDNKMQVLTGEYSSKYKKLVWSDIDYKCFKQCNVLCKIPEFDNLLSELDKYNKGQKNDVLVPYKDDIKWIDTKYKAGVTFNDRDTIYNYIKDYLIEKDEFDKDIEAIQLRSTPIGDPEKFIDESWNIDRELFLNQLDKAIDNKILSVEVYIDKEAIKEYGLELDKLKVDISTYLNKYLSNSKHKIVFKTEYNFIRQLDIGNNEYFGVEKRIKEIENKLKNVTEPTLSLVFIKNKEYYSKLDIKNNRDPKLAIRSGFALMGRLTQFITFENYSNEVIRIEQLIKNTKAEEIKEKEKINKILQAATLDGFRQLGVVFNYTNRKALKNKDIVGIHITKNKKNIYNKKIKPFPIITRYDVENSKIYAYCDLVDKVEVSYWKLNLALAKLIADREVETFIKDNLLELSLYKRLDRMIEKNNKELIVIVDSNARGFIKGISNIEIANQYKKNTEEYNLMIRENKVLNISKKDNISLIRLRHNGEVPSYIPFKNKNNDYNQSSGIYKYDEVYYIIESKPKHEGLGYKQHMSKVDSISSFSHRRMIEVFPIFMSDESEKNKKDTISILRKLKYNSIQFDSKELILPLPLHLALKSEEYLEINKIK